MGTRINCQQVNIICQFIFVVTGFSETEMYQPTEYKHFMLAVIGWEGEHTQLALRG